ncbi:3-deoxy-manno-octulosonate cytidylyltransferase [Luteimonas sp. BDR2-5]|uniref:3-deoxy-manno-octulosonate cytidylyltransferase n=1 Tax=Proluteimonas luteida TaxID=2878685 RepID=UPI001E45C549|nr:3-deoxy-manno-octulosonate cytidylyltransferase [Luteimonas sp. BDR2-5]MCD9027739.1 3-deoxy-manno-octulosonate cytidylyltransferase [Luteimonas sp. BDR2-5]
MTPPSDFVVAIPARYASTRLPGKPLQPLGGRPLVLHVAERALAAGAREVWVATDDARVRDALAGTPVRVAMTSDAHPSGTDRLAECAAIAGWDDDIVVVNLQGDEPFAPVDGIRAVAALARQPQVALATLATAIDGVDALFDPNTVKVVRDARGHALYFSRAPVPWPRDAFLRDRGVLPAGDWWRHIGIYGYRTGFLKTFAAMPPGVLEQVEMLEQLRVLEAGHAVAVGIAPSPFPPGVDTPEDLARAEARLAAGRTG